MPFSEDPELTVQEAIKKLKKEGWVVAKDQLVTVTNILADGKVVEGIQLREVSEKEDRFSDFETEEIKSLPRQKNRESQRPPTRKRSPFHPRHRRRFSEDRIKKLPTEPPPPTNPRRRISFSNLRPGHKEQPKSNREHYRQAEPSSVDTGKALPSFDEDTFRSR